MTEVLTPVPVHYTKLMKCTGKRKCSFDVSTNKFGDPYPGKITLLRIFIRHSCQLGKGILKVWLALCYRYCFHDHFTNFTVGILNGIDMAFCFFFFLGGGGGGVKYWNNKNFQEEIMELRSSQFLRSVVLVYKLRV